MSEVPGSERYWAVIKANLTPEGRPYEEELNEWWSLEHQPKWVRLPGFHRSWRLHTIRHDGQLGDPGQEYLAVYEVDSIDAFTYGLRPETFDEPPWGQWQEHVEKWIVDWGRTYYRLLYRYNAGDDGGSYWALVRTDLDLTSQDEEAEFSAWYNEKHIPEICSYDGFHQVWRLEVHCDPSELGPPGHRFVSAYQIDQPENLVNARKGREEKGIKPFDGIWLPKVRDFAISFHEIIHRENPRNLA